jgi:hypothetical protein
MRRGRRRCREAAWREWSRSRTGSEGRALGIRRWLERPALWREPCLSAVDRSGPEAVGTTLDRLGDMRFRARAAYLSRRVDETGTDQALWEALLEALGYGGDYRAYRALAGRVRWPLLRIALLATPIAQRAADAYGLLAAEAEDLRSAGARASRPANRPESGYGGRRRSRRALPRAGPSTLSLGFWTAPMLELTTRGSKSGKRKTENGYHPPTLDFRFAIFARSRPH